MADTAKRPNVSGGKTPVSVATPNVGPQGMVSMEQALSGALGARIRIQTSPPTSQTLEGTLFTICPLTSILALSFPSQILSQPPTYHLLSLSSLSSFTLLSPPQSTPLPPLPSLNTPALEARANAALARAKEKASKINKSVGKEAQDMFDALDRQFGARWQGRDMVVMDQVHVKGPGYRVEDCRAGTKDGAGLLGRVKKVLENERKRLSQRDTNKPVKPAIPNIVPAIPAPQGQRKGG